MSTLYFIFITVSTAISTISHIFCVLPFDPTYRNQHFVCPCCTDSLPTRKPLAFLMGLDIHHNPVVITTHSAATKLSAPCTTSVVVISSSTSPSISYIRALSMSQPDLEPDNPSQQIQATIFSLCKERPALVYLITFFRWLASISSIGT